MSGKEKTERLARDEEENQRTMRDGMLRMLLTSEARERLTNIRMVKPDVSKIIEDNIIRLASTGKLSPPITDEHIKQLLLSIQKPKREFKIRRV
ncbi:MAG: DNA-binding protein [Nitrososphaerales archaeon]|jgi:programmed cell death protein 5|nr:DNA-binding protein [Nitrososphaerales archaeon]|tara:strand:+ start:4262 stop:4543 length:282 start_codon:yes stop_codon:yes gene_type:complete